MKSADREWLRRNARLSSVGNAQPSRSRPAHKLLSSSVTTPAANTSHATLPTEPCVLQVMRLSVRSCLRWPAW